MGIDVKKIMIASVIIIVILMLIAPDAFAAQGSGGISAKVKT